MYQTTDAATNAPITTPNTPADIPAGGSQSFVFALTPTEAFATIDVPLSFACLDQGPALVVQGLNTLRLTACAGGVPDIIVIAVTPTHDGVVAVSGQAAFAAAAVNIGAVMSDGACSGLLPSVPGEDSRGFGFLLSAESIEFVDLAVCLTNPGNGLCEGPPVPVIALSMWPGERRTLSVFVTARDRIALDPVRARIKVKFIEQQTV